MNFIFQIPLNHKRRQSRDNMLSTVYIMLQFPVEVNIFSACFLQYLGIINSTRLVFGPRRCDGRQVVLIPHNKISIFLQTIGNSQPGLSTFLWTRPSRGHFRVSRKNDVIDVGSLFPCNNKDSTSIQGVALLIYFALKHFKITCYEGLQTTQVQGVVKLIIFFVKQKQLS